MPTYRTQGKRSLNFLSADYSSLVELAGGNSWQAELIAEDDGGTYWARLIRR